MFHLPKFKEVVHAVQESATHTWAIPEGATLEQLRDELLALMSQENSNHHRMGQIYNYIVDKRLAEKAGHKDAKEYFSKHLADLSQTALTLYGSVARTFTESVARRFGVTCLYLLKTYKELAGLEVNAEEPGPTPIEVPDAKGQLSTKPFSACSVEEMRRAIQRKRKPSSSKPLPPEKVVLAEQYAELVARRFPEGKGDIVKVAPRNQKGKAVMDIKGIPLEPEQVLLLAEALLDSLPPVNELPGVPPELRQS